jgi:hypothetical protein
MRKQGWQWQLTAAQHVFMLMPLRHAATKERLALVLEQCQQRDEWEARFAGEVLRRFRRATLRRLQVDLA